MNQLQGLIVTVTKQRAKNDQLSLFCHYNRVRTGETGWNQMKEISAQIIDR